MVHLYLISYFFGVHRFTHFCLFGGSGKLFGDAYLPYFIASFCTHVWMVTSFDLYLHLIELVNLAMCLYFDISLQSVSVESCVLGCHAKHSHSLKTIGHAHARPSISLIRCFAIPLTHFALSQFLCPIFSCRSTICVLQVLCLISYLCFLAHILCFNDVRGVRMPCLCILYSNAIILISAQTLGSSPTSFKQSFACLLMHIL